MIRQKIDSKSPNFIGCWKIDNEKLFSDMINFFENNPQLQSKGSVSSGTDEAMKKTTDIEVSVLSDIKKQEMPERKLFLAVIFQALLDATKPKEKKESAISVMNRDRAIAWFFASVGVTAEDFHSVCDYAGVNPVYMREFAFKVLKSGEVEYVRKRINAVLGHE